MSSGAREPLRSMSARTAAGAARVTQNRHAQPNGIWGMALFLCAEVSLFGLLIGTYFDLDFNSRYWPPDGIKAPSVVLPLIATGVLLATLVPIRFASQAARSGRRSGAIAGISVALVIQSLYLALQIILFLHDLHQFTPQASAYGSIYFTMLAVHHAHVLLGIVLDLALIWMLATRGLTNYWLIGVRALALYWYVVGAVAVLVVLTQLAPSL